MADPFHYNVGGRQFSSLHSTLIQSPLLATLLSDKLSAAHSHTDGIPFVDRNPDLFEHVLQSRRTSFPPVIWSQSGGFDLSLYTRLLREAEYFQLLALAGWIREAGYATSIRITRSVSRELLTDCEWGLFWNTGPTRKHFETGSLSSLSNSGRSTSHWKRVHIESITLHSPVGASSSQDLSLLLLKWSS